MKKCVCVKGKERERGRGRERERGSKEREERKKGFISRFIIEHDALLNRTKNKTI
jgi:hypothetical protein